MAFETAFTIVLAYLMGAFPTAYVVGRYLKGVDVRRLGSRNSGALNAYRQLGKGEGLLVLAVDAGKGAAAIFVGERLGVPDVALYVSAFLATIGHNFSPFLRFRGGKGVATVLGLSAMMLWQITAVSAVVGAVSFAATRRIVWSIAAAFVINDALTIGTLQPPGQIALCLVLTFVVAGTHFYRQYPEIALAVRQRSLKRFMSIE